jgi:hypothetical protein
MRDLILAAVARTRPLPGKQRLLRADGNIVELLLEEGVDADVALHAASEATGVPVARRAWLDGPLPSWPLDFDPVICRQLGVCPVAFRRGQWVVAYADPELAVAADQLALPEHTRALALTRDLERFFDAAPSASAVAETATDSGLFSPVSRLELSADQSEEDDEAADNNDDDDDALDLYVDRLAPASPLAAPQRSSSAATVSSAASPRASSSVEGVSAPPRVPMSLLDPALPPSRRDGMGTTTASSSAARTRARHKDPGARASDATTSSLSSSSSSSSSAKPKRFAGAPAVLGRRAVLLVGAAISVAVWAVVWFAWPSPPPPPPPGALDRVVVTPTGFDFTKAQRALLDRALSASEPATTRRLLTEAITLEPSSLEARTAMLERARLLIGEGQLGQADLDLERLRRRPDIEAIRVELEGLLALRLRARPAVAASTSTSPAAGETRATAP